MVADAPIASAIRARSRFMSSVIGPEPVPDNTRAILVPHGGLRNADVCYRSDRTA